MIEQTLPYVLAAFGVTLLSTGLAVAIWQRRPAPGVVPFALALLAIAVWAFGYGFELSAADLETKVRWAKFEYLGIVTLPVAWFLFAFDYSRAGRPYSRRWLGLLAVIPVITLILTWTNEAHGLIWTSTELAGPEPFARVRRTYGTWFWVHVSYAYLLLLAGTVALLWSLARRPPIYRGQAIALTLGALAPWLGNALYLARLTPIPNLDITPLTFAISGAAISWALYRYKLLDIVPVAFEGVVRDMADGVLVLNAQNQVVALNPAAEELFGGPAARGLGVSVDRLLQQYPELAGRLRETDAGHEEIILKTPSVERFFDLRISPLHDARGALSGRIVVLRDLSDRRRAEVEHLRLVQEQAARSESEAALRTRNEVLSTVSHDLKNPLSTIKITASRLRRRVGSIEHPAEEQLLESLERIEAMAGRMTSLLDELVEVTRLQLGHRLDLETGPTDLIALAHWVAAAQQPGSRRIQLVVDSALPELVGPWDAARVERVLTNLVSNAVKYSPRGGRVQVSISRETNPCGEWAVLTVSDQGLGIPAADLPHIFDWFYRAGNVTGRIGGTGIGLASTRQIIEQHGGTISVTSQEGRGSIFTVRLPLSDPEPE